VENEVTRHGLRLQGIVFPWEATELPEGRELLWKNVPPKCGIRNLKFEMLLIN
jgi:hypothetical protein